MKIPFKGAAIAVKEFVRQNSSSICVGIAVVGVVGTAISSGDASIKAYKALEKLKYENDEKPTTKEKVKAVAPYYIPPIVIASTTIGLIIFAHSKSLKTQAALASAYSVTDAKFKEYRNKVEETIGEKKETEIHDEISKDTISKHKVSDNHIIKTDKGETLCFDTLSGRYFCSDIEYIRKVINNINADLTSGPETYVSLNDFYIELGLSPIKMGEELGWNICNEGKLDVLFSSQLTDTGEPCLVLDYAVGPNFGYSNEY